MFIFIKFYFIIRRGIISKIRLSFIPYKDIKFILYFIFFIFIILICDFTYYICISILYSLYLFNIFLGVLSTFFIKPLSIICFLNSLFGIILLLFLFFSNFLIYLPKYNNFISYLSFTFFISFISNDENGKNNTSFSFG